MMEIFISKILALLGLQLVDKRLYRKNYFRDESSRLMRPIEKEYFELIQQYEHPKNRMKAIQNQILFFEMVHWLGLQKAKPCRILDIGGKAGLFGYFCKVFNHEAYTTDLPGILAESPNKEIIGLLGVSAFDLVVEPFVPLDVGEQKFELITGFRTRFHSKMPHETGNDFEEHWGIEEWDFFLRDIAGNVLEEDGRIFFMLNPLQERTKGGCVPGKLADYFRSVEGELRQQFLYFPNVEKLRS